MMQRSPQTFSHYPAIPPPVAVGLTVLPEHPCVYLSEKTARIRAMMVNSMPGEIYLGFMNAGFRRSGKVIYQPVCNGCRACVPIRLRVNHFKQSKSQRRCWRKNADLSVTQNTPVVTEEKFDLYCRYITDRHGEAEQSREDFERFLYESPVQTIEFEYRDSGGRLVAVGICDVCADSLSSVYFYFDPFQTRRSLGTYGLLKEIEYARMHSINHYYLGYWVRGSASMQYKSQFVPNEILNAGGVWELPEVVGDGEHF